MLVDEWYSTFFLNDFEKKIFIYLLFNQENTFLNNIFHKQPKSVIRFI